MQTYAFCEDKTPAKINHFNPFHNELLGALTNWVSKIASKIVNMVVKKMPFGILMRDHSM